MAFAFLLINISNLLDTILVCLKCFSRCLQLNLNGVKDVDAKSVNTKGFYAETTYAKSAGVWSAYIGGTGTGNACVKGIYIGGVYIKNVCIRDIDVIERLKIHSRLSWSLKME